MAKGKKMSREEMLEKKRKAERDRYQRIKIDSQKYEEQREKERQKYLQKRERGIIKAAKDMIPRENRIARKRWRTNVTAFRAKRAALKEMTNNFIRSTSSPNSDNEHPRDEFANEEPQKPDKKASCGRKKSERIRKLRNKVLKQQQGEIQRFKTKLNRYKKRLYRAKQKH